MTSTWPDARLGAGEVELLEVAHEDVLGRLGGHVALGLEQLHAELHGVDARDLGQLLHSHLVARSAGRRLEEHGVGEDGRHHQAGHLLADGDLVLLVEVRDDAARRAHWLIEEEYGLAGSEAADLVVVYDLNDVLHIELVHSLSHLIVVYQDDLLVGGIGELLRIWNFEVIQQELGLVVDVSCGCRDGLFHSQGILQIRISYCRCYRIGIWTLVPNYIDLVGQMKHLSIVNVELRLKAY